MCILDGDRMIDETTGKTADDRIVKSWRPSMFEIKPPSATLEFIELAQAFTPGQLGEAFDRHPETVARWTKRVPHTVESVVDRFWYVMHVAVTQAD